MSYASMSNAKQAKRLDWRIHDLNAEMMAALEESGGEFTPEVGAIEARLMKDVDAFAELGAGMKVYAKQMLGMVAEEAAAGIPGARLEFFEDCGHLLPLEEPERVVRAIVAVVEETLNR